MERYKKRLCPKVETKRLASLTCGKIQALFPQKRNHSHTQSSIFEIFLCCQCSMCTYSTYVRIPSIHKWTKNILTDRSKFCQHTSLLKCAMCALLLHHTNTHLFLLWLHFHKRRILLERVRVMRLLHTVREWIQMRWRDRDAAIHRMHGHHHWHMWRDEARLGMRYWISTLNSLVCHDCLLLLPCHVVSHPGRKHVHLLVWHSR